MRSKETRFAVVYTIKNEATLLSDAIRYYEAIGVARIFLFFDGTTDGSREIAARFKCVSARDTVTPPELDNCLPSRPRCISEMLPKWETDMDTRKRINTYYAARQASLSGIEWLLCIDVDELFIVGENSAISAGAVSSFFEMIPESTEQVLIKNLELLPSPGKDNRSPFEKNTYFLKRSAGTDLAFRWTSALVRRLVRSPSLHAWYNWLFYYIRYCGRLPRLMRHPRTGELIPGSYYLGYNNHKSIIRTKCADEFNFCVHFWGPIKRSPRTIYAGILLHYFIFSADGFAQKYRQRQVAYNTQKVFHLNYMLARVAVECSNEETDAFYHAHVALAEGRNLKELVSAGVAIEIATVADVLSPRGSESSEKRQ